MQPYRTPRDQHSISRRDISQPALRVLYRLHEHGYRACLVGGCVRDLLLGHAPKDFDVVTDATPEEITTLFRGSRIIGRRFQIVHVRMGREITEVSTFRAAAESDDVDANRTAEGMILRDNVFGPQEEDALRRDFTINALYYDIADFALVDYVGGMADLEARVIRLIGEPAQRYREDPVRLLRAARFVAKLGFHLAPETAAPIEDLKTLLRDVPPARLFDEVVKLFMTGHGAASFQALRNLGLLPYLLPGLNTELECGNGFAQRLVEAALRNTDERLANQQPVTPGFLFAALLWPSVERHRAALLATGESPLPALQVAAQRAIATQLEATALPKRFSFMMREIWELQLRLPRRTPRNVAQMAASKRFRAGYDFVLLREQAGEDLGGLGAWWTQYQDADASGQQKLIEALPRGPKRKKKRTRAAASR
ncbi:MAG: polynucleotide adenylyltransferase PcnB [Pseudomonadota bacterium]|nr:polynucleotide adenylyltransferase PcnB [Pseudomonadota bacterium]